MVVNRQLPCVALAQHSGGDPRLLLFLVRRPHSETVWVKERLWARQVKGGGGSEETTVNGASAGGHLGKREIKIRKRQTCAPGEDIGVGFPCLAD